MTNTQSLPLCGVMYPDGTVGLAAAAQRILTHPPQGLLAGASLFLDFDGTLVELAERPDLVQVSPVLPDLLETLGHHLDGRLALVSGRGAEELAALLGDPDIMIAGSHGAELRLGRGSCQAPPRPAALNEAVLAIGAFARDQAGLLVEDKPHGVALHYRGRPEAAQACEDLALRVAQQFGLELQPGKMVVELRAAGQDKGLAVRQLMERAAMRGTKPVFIGDDRTDEAAFRAVADLGGAGILVGDADRTCAVHQLPNVAAVYAWLKKEVKQ